MENLIDDVGRLNKFLEILPENKVNELVNDQLRSGQYIDGNTDMIGAYNQYWQTTFSHFQNPKIEKAKEDFDIIFKKLNTFLIDNFDRRGNSVVIDLLPMHSGSAGGKSLTDIWKERLIDLTLLCKEFDEKYKALISIAIKELYKAQKISNTGKDKINRPIINLPLGTTWEDLEIKFKDELEVEVYAKGKFYESVTNEKLTFSKGKEKKPNRLWEFLLLLSVIQESNEFSEDPTTKSLKATIGTMADSLGKKCGETITSENCQQIKSNLSDKLQEVFGIENDKPFYDYKEHDCYRTKFKLRPMPGLRRDGEPFITERGKFKEDIDYNRPKTSYRKSEY